MGQAGLRVVIVSERLRAGARGARRTTLNLVPRWGDPGRPAAAGVLPARAQRAGRLAPPARVGR